MRTNKVVLIGESHYHGLNLLRSFGEAGIKPFGILIGDDPDRFMEASSCWTAVYHAEDNVSAVELLLNEFAGETEKPVVIPWSDGALAALDERLDQLKDHFILSSINGTEGEIGRWMDKKKQAVLGKELGLLVCPTDIVTVPPTEDELQNIAERHSFPVFLKPVDSREGTKKDMRKLNSIEEISDYCVELEQKGFKRILVQDYLNITVELDCMGCCCSEGRSSFTIAEKCRIWPPDGGAACFGRIVPDKSREAVFDSVVKKLSDFGYSGPFDIDFFQVGDKLYFNEINWRSSANVYAAVMVGNNYPYRWYLAATGQPVEIYNGYTGKERFFMNEFWDFHHVLRGRITLMQWLHDKARTDAFAFWNKKDNKPFWARLWGMLAKRLAR